jgi:hypothetical protein
MPHILLKSVPLVLLLALIAPEAASAQGTSTPTTRSSNVGYVDPALPLNVFRLRYDDAWNARRPNRAEFIYAQGQPLGPGLPLPETSIDFQDVSAYLEVAAFDRLSAFVELPVRFINPEINANSAGLGDMNAGFKFAFLSKPDQVATFQLRTYAPTGAASRGLGNHHVSIEPGLLFYQGLADRLAVEGEFKWWIPVGGTDFAGDVLRYGLGVSCNVCEVHKVRVSPVLEVVGWTVLDGKESFLAPDGTVPVEDAAGDTIVDVKAGVRLRLADVGDFYTGYGRPLTGDRWYENVYRVELRLFF